MRLSVALLCALTLGLASAPGAWAELQPNPFADQGSSPDYRSLITSVTPPVHGLQLEILQFSDRLLLTNHTGKTVTVLGYQDEPYARVRSDGAVEVNTHSQAYFLNQSFYADVSVPAYATKSATPRWSVIDRTGQLEWHDHRIHWMSPIPPSKVTDKSKRTFIFDWQVPLVVGNRPATINGELFWVPESSKVPAGAIVALVLLTLLAIALVIAMRRRRARRPPAGTGRGEGRRPEVDMEERLREAW